MDAVRVLAALSALLAIVWIVGCAGAREDAPAVRVGATAIDERTVDHWSSLIARGALVASVGDPAQQSPRQQALASLIAYAWLNGEAARYGLAPSRQQVERAVQGQRNASPGGAAGFKTTLAESGQTLADVEAEARAKLAAAALEHRLAQVVDRYARARVTDRVVASFYRAHIARYHLPERRYYDLYEQIPKRSEALALARRLRSGEPISRKPNKEKPLRPRNFRNLPGQANVYRAVFSARRTNVIVGPMLLRGQWCLFILRRIVPARLQPLSEVRGAIERRLRAPVLRHERASLIAAFRQRWLARTDCRPGYVVQKCRQYRGPRKTEAEPFAGF